MCSSRPTDVEFAQRTLHGAHLIRLILWGGAATPGDNSAFEFAARNVAADYRTIAKGGVALVQQRIKVAKDIVTQVKIQAENSICSLDVFTHGGPQALYLTTADASSSPITRYVFHNSSLYRSRTRMVLNAAGWTDGSALVGDLDFSKFSANAKIELHGCATAEADSDTDNIAADLSSRLWLAGKLAACVIGHADKANPNIKGGR